MSDKIPREARLLYIGGFAGSFTDGIVNGYPIQETLVVAVLMGLVLALLAVVLVKSGKFIYTVGGDR